MFHAYDQVAVHVYLYWTQDTIEGKSFARDLLVTVNTVSSPLSMFFVLAAAKTFNSDFYRQVTNALY